MELRLLGKTGLRVSELCLGTMTFGRDAGEETAFRIMDEFEASGGNFFDTADVYNQGRSEEILGKWLSNRNREDYIVATKVRFATSDKPNSVGLTRKHIRHSVEGSLRRLKTDYIDILQVHAWDPITDLSETLSALQALVDEGKVLHIGASNFRAWQLMLALSISRENGLSEFVSLQPQYSLLCRATEFELIPLCVHENIAVLPWSPLKGGVLSGKYTVGGEVPDGTRLRSMVSRGIDVPWKGAEDYYSRVLKAVHRIAQSKGVTDAQVSLAWLLNRKGVTSPIIGARSVEQVRENIGSVDVKLTREEMDELDRASSLYVTYPYDEQAERQQMSGRV
ncbi:aldo/keto reductase [Thermogymnomonas acidicola]|uniref:Aldo/keto reductase n=1 Tax=Thermogymnomonas acidicola TaxID=399579 RepID=A0AA37BQJ6_9ARCH|nr:aldo/keto reductase [Thermogymnomonas acidicola]GGM70030.1 aldo/keto reductase [Thermogymnomonas acidicola]